jgi:hypothetical protein
MFSLLEAWKSQIRCFPLRMVPAHDNFGLGLGYETHA